MMTRRNVVGALGLTAAAAGAWRWLVPSTHAETQGDFEVSLTPEEWRQRLTEEQYYVLREHGTERAFTSPLDKETREGFYHCAGCEQAVYSSQTKYDSGTGWPSFWKPIDGAIGTSEDNTLFMTRTEVHCSRCGGHLGHVFEDGPQPTGLRYCMNGVAMAFKPAVAGATG